MGAEGRRERGTSMLMIACVARMKGDRRDLPSLNAHIQNKASM